MATVLPQSAAQASAPVRVPHLAALDGLRGIAILVVLWYHYWELSFLGTNIDLGFTTLKFDIFATTGSSGVDLFFFISGFVIFFPYARTLFDGAPMQSLAMFAYRRALKIVPSYYLAIALFIVLGFSKFNNFDEAVWQVAAHAIFMQNLWDDTYGGISGVLWSLGTEVQFYIVFPLVCWCAMRRPLVTFGLLIVGADIYRYLILAHPNVVREADRLPGTIDLFACGMLAAWLYRYVDVKRPELAKRRGLWTGVAVVAGFAIVQMLSWQYDHRYDQWWNLGWKVGFRPIYDVAIVPFTVGSLFAAKWWERVLANRFFVFLALISYNLYIWHQKLGEWLFNAHWIPYKGTDPHSDRVWALEYFVSAFALSCAVAWLITAFVEQPLLRRKPFIKFVAKPRAAQSPAAYTS